MKKLLRLACIVLLAASAAGRAAPPTPIPGLRVYTVGHSFHFWVAPILREIADLGGVKGHVVAGVAYRGGSTVQKIWDEAAGAQAREALEKGGIDVLTLAPIWMPDDGIEKFVKLGLEHNANLRVTVQEYWLPNDEYKPVYPLETKKAVDHNATDLGALREANRRYEADVEAQVRALNQRLGREVVFVVPVGAASVALREKINAGEAPGLKVSWRLFADSWGHPTTPLRILAAYCHYAVIYRRSPVGLPMPGEFLRNQEYANPKLNLLLQEIAWNTVVNHPHTGVTTPDKK